METGARLRQITTLYVSALFVTFVGACKSGPTREEQKDLKVFAASSLTEAFQDLESGFERDHPNIDVQLTLAGSQVLRLQIEQGAAADVFASANPEHMQALSDQDLAARRAVFARNELVVVVPKTAPTEMQHFADLAQAQRIVVGSAQVPVGSYTRQVLQKAEEGMGVAFAADVRKHIVSEETNVRLVRAKVEMGVADAAVVYRTDAVACDQIRAIAIPKEYNVAVDYPIAPLSRAEHGREAERFVEYVLSSSGQDILRKHGFVEVLN